MIYNMAEKQTFAVLFCLGVENSAAGDRRDRKMKKIRYYNNNIHFRKYREFGVKHNII